MSRESIKSDLTGSDLRLLYDRIGVEDIDIQIPARLGGSRIGLGARIIQFLNSWAYRCPHSQLYTYASLNSVDDYLDGSCKWPTGIVSFLLGMPVLAVDGSDISKRALEAAFRALSEQENGGLKPISSRASAQEMLPLSVDRLERSEDFICRGGAASIICADDTTVAESRWLYASMSTIREAREFQSLPLRLLKSDLSLSRVPRSFSATALTDFGKVMRELFENTHLWARTGFDLITPIKASIRGIHSAYHRKERIETIVQDKNESAYIKNYLTRLLSENHRFDLIELSIFDAGIGLASRFTGKNFDQLSVEEEYEALIQCLIKGASSSGDLGRGTGLFLVQRALSRIKGMLSIRSGHLDLYRDFNAEPFSPQTESEGVDRQMYFLHDTVSYPAIQKYPWAKGTAITVLIRLFIA